jgi:hypothetical protein
VEDGIGNAVEAMNKAATASGKMLNFMMEVKSNLSIAALPSADCCYRVQSSFNRRRCVGSRLQPLPTQCVVS